MINENSWEELTKDREIVIIELGCGTNKRISDSIGIDQLKMDGVDYVADLKDGMKFIPSNSVDKIVSSHFLEHLEDVSSLMLEVARVLKPGGMMMGWVTIVIQPIKCFLDCIVFHISQRIICTKEVFQSFIKKII